MTSEIISDIIKKKCKRFSKNGSCVSNNYIYFIGPAMLGAIDIAVATTMRLNTVITICSSVFNLYLIVTHTHNFTSYVDRHTHMHIRFNLPCYKSTHSFVILKGFGTQGHLSLPFPKHIVVKCLLMLVNMHQH